MWLFYAIGSAFFAGVTSILAKCGIRKTDSTVATAVRTIVILIFSWIIVFIVGSQDQITEISGRTLLFLILSGAATGASWLCYFKALQIGDINKVVPIDKSSTVLTILLALIFLQGDEERERRLVPVCRRLCVFCQPDSDPRKDRNHRSGVQSRNCHPYLCRAGHGVGHGVCDREAGRGEEDWEERACVYLLLRYRHRRLLAVLLPGAAGRTGKCGSSD